MEGKGPYRIYDPGGSEVKARDEIVGGSSYRQLLEENSMLRERMKGLKSLGKPCLHPTAEKEERSSCLGRTLQPEKPHVCAEFYLTQLKRLESSFSIFAEESNPNQLLAHLGRMAVEFHHLSSKVQKNEQRTSLLQV
ncbi:hypothetical protein XENOCAPTIV_010952 [Xenoophorus captivus]|uniref:Uncharacterized protein n=1 Tax=Xenoophorus captivus TaxID=1517983 RepID=A0ABV0Q4W2_9TELE